MEYFSKNIVTESSLPLLYITVSLVLGNGSMSDTEILREVKKLDLNGDGMINPDEFDESLK